MLQRIRKLTYQTGLKHVFYPEITIGGKFLREKYNLSVGDKVEVVYGKKNITIKTRGKKQV